MKKVFLLVISLLTGLCVFGQNKLVHADLDKIISFSLPNESSRLAPGKVRMSGSIENKVPENAVTASLGEMYIQLTGVTGIVDADYLEKRQKGITDLANSLGVKADYQFQTKSINNYKVLILRDTTNTVIGKYQFFCLPNDQKSVVSGVIEYPYNNKAEAKIELDKLLASIKFK